MKLKLLYTLVLIICLSAFASSKDECTCTSHTGSSKGAPAKETQKEISGEIHEFSTFQFAKFLYI